MDEKPKIRSMPGQDGVAASEFAQQVLQNDAYDATPIDYERKFHEQYDQELQKCVLDGKQKYQDSFFVVVLTRKEKLPSLKNVVRRMFFHRKTCPTPQWQQTVYMFHYSSSVLQFLWTIPSQEWCAMLKYRALELDADEKTLLDYVIEYEEGKLLALARKLNDEDEHAPQIALLLPKENDVRP